MRNLMKKLVLTLWICILSVGKNMAQNTDETLPISFVYPETYSELTGYASDNINVTAGLQSCISHDYAKAVSYLQRAAKQGEGLAMAVLGDLYAHGRGVKANRQIAMNMFTKGIQAKSPLAHCYLGELYRREGQNGKAQNEYSKAYQLDRDCLYALYLTTAHYWRTKQYGMAVYGMELMLDEGVNGMAGTLGEIYAAGKNVPADYGKAFDYLTRDNCRYTNHEQLILAELYYYGRGTGENDVKKMQRSSKYTSYYYEDGEDGRSSITDALIVLERLVNDGYEPAQTLYRTVKDEFDEREKASNVLTCPQWGKDVVNYIQSYKRPSPPAIKTAGYGEIVVSAHVSALGHVSDVALKARVLQRLDEEALRLVRNMPTWKAGTRGGFPTDMIVNIGISFFPTFKVRLKSYALAQ